MKNPSVKMPKRMEKLSPRRKFLVILSIFVLDIAFGVFAAALSFMLIGTSNLGVAMADIPEAEKFRSEYRELFAILFMTMFLWSALKMAVCWPIFLIRRSEAIRTIAKLSTFGAIAFLILAILTPIIMFWGFGVDRIGERFSFYLIMILIFAKLLMQSLWY